ncbi:MAG: leucine-rich repeat domain-containing protein [Candidatus Fibromonas sp.]|jgi:hypothetical protein|nr:leucine-rich repeat domain-containing protein [Candidatus Fibromonas sp.]
MKRNIIVIAALCIFCGPAFAQQYWTGDGGKGIRLAVLEPEGKGISQNDKWTLSVVQNVIYTDFSKYSDMTIIDRQNLEKVFEEWKESMSGHYSDADRIKIGNLTNASHILSGTIIKTPNAFMLELSVTNLQSGERKASYSQPVSAAALENHSAIKEASADLLKQLGVDLTGTALAELKQTANIARIQAEEALARGIVAKRQGTEVAALSYFYQAAALDPAMLEAANRSSVMAANISSGNIGADTRNDILWRRDWVARLKEAEQFFDNLFKTNPLPYTLFYSTKITPGEIDYETETQTLSINTNLRASGAWVWLSSVEKALQAVYDGLDATKRKRDWGLDSWPWRGVTELEPFESKRKTFSIVAELLNDKGKVIGRTSFESRGQWGFNRYGRPQISISDDDRKKVEFASVKADDITDRITIRIESVNNIEANAAARTRVLQVKAISEAEWDSYVLFRMGRGRIIGYNGKGNELVIPDSIWNEPVTSIGDGAFRYRGITSIIIGENVEVHENAFDNKFSEFYNRNYSRYGWQERRAGMYTYYGSDWTLTLSEEETAMLEQQQQDQERERQERLEQQRQEWQERQEQRQERERWERERPEREQQRREEPKIEKKKVSMSKTDQTSWRGTPFLSLGGAFFMGSKDFPYSGKGGLFSFGGEGGVDLFRIGLNIDLGLISVDGIKKIYPDAITDSTSMAALFKISAFARLYPVNAWYLSGGAGIGYYGDYYSETKSGDEVSGSGTWAPVFSVGTGLVSDGGIYIDVRYNILPSKSDVKYVTVNIVITGQAFINQAMRR